MMAVWRPFFAGSLFFSGPVRGLAGWLYNGCRRASHQERSQHRGMRSSRLGFFLCTRGVLTALSCVVAVANANRSNVSRNVLAAGIPHQRGVVPCSWAHLPETRGEGERTAPDVRESAPLGPVRRTCSSVASRRCFVYSNKHGPSNGKAPAVPASSQNKRRGGNKHVEEEDHSTVGFNLPDTVPAIVDVLHQKLPF